MEEAIDDLSFADDRKIADLSDEEWDELVEALSLGSEPYKLLLREALKDNKPDYCPNCGEEL